MRSCRASNLTLMLLVAAAVWWPAAATAAQTCDGGLGPSPPIAISPTQGQYAGQPIVITGSDPGWRGVDAIGFYLGGKPLAVATVDSTGSFELTVTVPPDLASGQHMLRYEYAANWIPYRCETPYTVLMPIIFSTTVVTVTPLIVTPTFGPIITPPDITAAPLAPVVVDTTGAAVTTEAPPTTASPAATEGIATTATTPTTAATAETSTTETITEADTAIAIDLPRSDGGSTGFLVGFLGTIGVLLAAALALTIARRRPEPRYHGLPPGPPPPPPGA